MTENQSNRAKDLGVPWDTPLNESFSVHCADVRVNGDLDVTVYFVRITMEKYIEFYRLFFTEWSGIRCTWEGRFGFPQSYYADVQKTKSRVFSRIIENSEWLAPPDCPTIPKGTKHYYISTWNNVIEIATHRELLLEPVAESIILGANLLGNLEFTNLRCERCGGFKERPGWGQCPHPGIEQTL